MSKERVSNCVDCERCQGSSCRNYYGFFVYHCDECGESLDPEYNEIYSEDGKEDLCESCLLKRFRKDVDL